MLLESPIYWKVIGKVSVGESLLASLLHGGLLTKLNGPNTVIFNFLLCFWHFVNIIFINTLCNFCSQSYQNVSESSTVTFIIYMVVSSFENGLPSGGVQAGQVHQ